MPRVFHTHHNHNHNHNQREPKRLLKLLNYLGIINILGILAIIWLEKRSLPIDGSFPSQVHQTSESEALRPQSDGFAPKPIRNNHNRHKGINETVARLKSWGISVDAFFPRLPPWWWIEDQYGFEPKILGLDRCRAFRELHQMRPDEVVIAPAGLFNSGTNLLYRMLQMNCHFPNRSSAAYHGRGFQPPWGKHTPREFRETHRVQNALYQRMVLDAVLPIVLIRHPYDWFRSICEQPYGVHWREEDFASFRCPAICHRDNRTQEVLVSYGSGPQQYESIAHLYNRWNRGWYDTLAVPRIMIRMEDLIFRPDAVVPQVCACAGGSLIRGAVQVPFESAKADMSGHGNKKRSTNFLQAVVKYGNIRTWERFPLWDHVAARAILDKELLQVFGYEHPDLDVVRRNQKRNRLDQ